MASETTFVLRHDANTASAEPQVFGVFPGVWVPGEPKTAEELGLDDEEAKRLVKELGLPIDVKTPKAPKTDAKTEVPSASAAAEEAE